MSRVFRHPDNLAAISPFLIAGALCWCCWCAGGCSLFGGGREPISLKSRDPASKIPAIKKAVNARDSHTAQDLIKSLESDDPAVRFYAIRGLQDLTGETFGYVWYAEEQNRRDALDKWRHWLDHNGAPSGTNGTNGGAGGGTLARSGEETTPKD